MNFNIFWGFQKNEYFWGMKIFWIYFGGHHKNWIILGVISMHFRVLRSRCLGVDNFWLGPSLRRKKK